MIKSVTIKNFQAHENTHISFQDHLNLIVGLSNSGKSSIIRAMGVVVNNNWNKQMVRTGYEFCTVKIQTDKGWVEVERGEKVNRWKCKQNDGQIQLFKNVGTKVPDLATKILGMGERDRGGDIKQLPNFQFQLERHYMLSQVGEKKSTSNMIARMMDNAIGLGGMQDLIKDISSDLLKDKKWLTQKQNQITQLKSSITDELIFNDVNKHVENLISLRDKLSQMNESITKAEKVYDGYLSLKKKLEEKKDYVKSFEKIDDIEKLYKSINPMVKQIDLIEKIIKQKHLIQKSQKYALIDVDCIYKKIDECNKCLCLIELYEKSLNVSKKLNQKKKYADIDIDVIYGKYDQLNKQKQKIQRADDILVKARKVWKDRVSAKSNCQTYSKQQDQYHREFEKIKKQLGVCPLCGNKLV